MFKKKKKKKAPPSLVLQKGPSAQIAKEIQVAVDRYVDKVKRSNIFASSALYGNPWFMIVGPSGSGKSTLLNDSELHFPLKYPQDQDGETVSGMQWRFANNAVWLEVPGSVMNDVSLDLFKSVHSGLSKARSNRPVDGIVCVVSIDDIQGGDKQSIKELAASIRKGLDELIASWGIELPVYCIFSKLDRICGFKEFFKHSASTWNSEIMGATLSAEQQQTYPKNVLQQEYELICASLKSVRLKLLSKEKENAARRQICRFVIEFEGLQAKLGDFVSELFKESTYEGKPVFRGFYFSSNLKAASTAPIPLQTAELSSTIANHVLNPHRQQSAAPKPGAAAAPRSISYFTKRLFEEIFPDGTQVVQRTQRYSREHSIKYWVWTGSFAALFLLISLYLLRGYTNTRGLYRQTELEIAQLSSSPRSRIEAYEQLGRLGALMDQYKELSEKGAPLSYGLGFVKAKKIDRKLKSIYSDWLSSLIIRPSTKYLEYSIGRLGSGYGEITGEEYKQLYRELKTYLSMSEAVAQNPERIEINGMKEILEESLIKTILATERMDRLPENVEIILKNNVALYCDYLKAGEMTRIQANQGLVNNARGKLAKLPDAQILYESIRDRLAESVPTINLVQLLGGRTDALLSSDATVSALFCQEGWDRFVSSEMSAVAKNPFQVDWVLGTTKENIQVSAFDPQQMYQEMVQAYQADVHKQWLDFLATVRIESSGDLLANSLALQRLSANGSDLDALFTNLLQLSTIDVSKEDNAVVDAAKAALNKKTAKLRKTADKFNLLPTASITQVRSPMDPVKSFAKSEGRLGGMMAFKERLSALSAALSQVAKEGNYTKVFSGGEQDPLVGAWELSQALLGEMPYETAQAMTPILADPIKSVSGALADGLAKELNAKWQSTVAALFTNRFAVKYPFQASESESSFEDVMDFFRPKTGVLWGFYEQHLSSYIVKNGRSWKMREGGIIKLPFDPTLLAVLGNAQKISDAFFNPDGTVIAYRLAIEPLGQNTMPATLIYGTQDLKLTPGEKVWLNWPQKSESDRVSLNLMVNKSFTEEIKATGPWSLLRLFSTARLSVMNAHSFMAIWERTIQNMVGIRYACEVTVTAGQHPFSTALFTGFDCPADIMKKSNSNR